MESAEQLREKAADSARMLVKAHKENDMPSFHLALGMLMGVGQLIYVEERREMYREQEK